MKKEGKKEIKTEGSKDMITSSCPYLLPSSFISKKKGKAGWKVLRKGRQ